MVINTQAVNFRSVVVSIAPPHPDAKLAIQIENFPVRLWWKLLETSQKRKVSVNYLIFSILAGAVGYSHHGESYDLLISEIHEHFGDITIA